MLKNQRRLKLAACPMRPAKSAERIERYRCKAW
jgi:hypothetical protein